MNIINGRDLCARRSVVWVGGIMSIFWYMFGILLRMSAGGRVCAGEYTDYLTAEQYEETKDFYLVDSAEFMINYFIAMPFYTILIIFILLIAKYAKGEIDHNRKLRSRKEKHDKKLTSRMK